MFENSLAYLLDLASQLGYLGIMMIVGLEYACFPIPSEVVLPFVGIGIVAKTYNLSYAFIASIIGGLTGSLICYTIGYLGGVPFLEWSKRRFPKTRKTILALNKWFEKYGALAVFLTRLLPLTRTYVSFLAGSQKLDLLVFLAYSSLGIFIWNAVLISCGYFLGNNLTALNAILQNYKFIAVGILIVMSYILFKKYRKKSLL